ncbi:hypothetical protein BDQ12DRAFT_675808 [Crucibulum laeve]|uniref:Zn(2)-C6 fungal-type domain-containing protein n=1 Tax=Crucibulum laeve TaxID=68775 RepID=A0A5C3MGZ4_9AGAR|nr:hypothetical protein BDQ12DRAFT_675808 [Crucibulum laeve]
MPSIDNINRHDSPSDTGLTMSSSIYPIGQLGSPTQMYSLSTTHLPSHAPPKRRQVKNACTNCQKACKKCNDARPCFRCVKYGIPEECVSSQRKPRITSKRGPYKKRDGTGMAITHRNQENPPASTSHSPPPGAPPAGSYPQLYSPPPGYYGQYSPPVARPGEAPPQYPYYMVQTPASPQGPSMAQEGDGHSYAQPMYPAYVVSFGPPLHYPSFAVPQDGQVPYGHGVYPKQPSGGELIQGGQVGGNQIE